MGGMILYAAADLLWATRIKATAEDAGVAARPVRSLEMLEARLADSDVRGLIVDLDAPELALELVTRMRDGRSTAGDRSVRVLAFGPHVRADLFQRVREAGADRAMARGAFASSLDQVLTDLDGPDSEMPAGGGEGAR
jgi:hypothetical protein